MAIDPDQAAGRAAMRVAADRLARIEAAQSGEHTAVASLEAMQATVHELHVHQIELELQNEALREAREALEVSRKRYFDLYDLAPVGYLTIAENGTIIEANLTFCRLLGLVRAEVVGQRASRFIPPEDQDMYYQQRKRLLETGKSQAFELQLTRHGFGPFPARVEANRIQDGADDCILYAAVSDISELKLAEQEQAKLQAQLTHARKMEAVGSLAGGIAHDFNNILTGIMGGLSLLELEIGGGEHQSDLDAMKEMVERAANLTRALLGFARRGKTDVQPLDLALVVENTAAMFGRTRKDIAIERVATQGLLAVLMDRTQLEQVLLNLFINAGQAMPDGGRIVVNMANSVTIGEELGSDEKCGYFVTLLVSDTGVGMDPETQSRAFEPFFTTKDIGKGTGLGLASVYGIVTGHGGTIQIDSVPGKGTTFTLRLPATHQQPRLDTIPPESMDCGHETILIVDDEDHVRSIYTRMLSKIGYTVLVASGGHQALDILARHRDQIGLVILDLTMPGMSGAETFRALRAMVPGCRVLLCSGHSKDGQIQSLLDSGCNGFIQKPFNIATLAAKIRNTLAVRRLSLPRG